MFGAKMTETKGNKLFLSRDSEAAFGTQSATMGGATMGGSFWIRGEDDRDKGKQTFFVRDSGSVWHPK